MEGPTVTLLTSVYSTVDLARSAVVLTINSRVSSEEELLLERPPLRPRAVGDRDVRSPATAARARINGSHQLVIALRANGKQTHLGTFATRRTRRTRSALYDALRYSQVLLDNYRTVQHFLPRTRSHPRGEVLELQRRQRRGGQQQRRRQGRQLCGVRKRHLEQRLLVVDPSDYSLVGTRVRGVSARTLSLQCIEAACAGGVHVTA